MNKKQLEFNFNKSTNRLADNIVDNNYNNSKNKNPFTQAAEKAKEYLSHTYNKTTGKFENFDGVSLPAKEANEVNEFWDKNFQNQKRDDYLASNKLAQKETPLQTWNRLDKQEKQRQKNYADRLEKYGIEESSKKVPGYPKVSDQPILANNINNKLTPEQRRKQNYLKTWGIEDGPHNPDLRNIIRNSVYEADAEKKNNPTVNRYKAFKDNQKKKLEEKKFNQHMENEYGAKAIGQHLRKKIYANKKAGRAPYQDFSSSDIIVAEDLKEKAQKRLKAFQTEEKIKQVSNETKNTLDDYITYKESLKEKPVIDFPSLDEWMAMKAPREDAGITGVKDVQHMKNIVDYSNRAFNLNNSKGIGPFFTGEDDD